MTRQKGGIISFLSRLPVRQSIMIVLLLNIFMFAAVLSRNAYAGFSAQRFDKDGLQTLKTKATAGDVASMMLLSRYYDFLTGLKLNDPDNPQGRDCSDESVYWLTKAVEKGNYSAAWSLALRFLNGEDAASIKKGVEWLRVAAENGQILAQDELGELYEQGKHVQQDFAKAAKWYKRAALNSYSHSTKKMAEFAAEGKGVEKNIIEAYAWLILLLEDKKVGKGSIAATEAIKMQESLKEQFSSNNMNIETAIKKAEEIAAVYRPQLWDEDPYEGN